MISYNSNYKEKNNIRFFCGTIYTILYETKCLITLLYSGGFRGNEVFGTRQYAVKQLQAMMTVSLISDLELKAILRI